MRDSWGPEGIKLSLERWLDETTNTKEMCRDSLAFSDTHLLIEAARQGEGIMLGRSVLIADDIISGKLVPVLSNWKKSPFAYYLVHSELRGLSQPAKIFRRWLLDEIEVFVSKMPEVLKVR